MPNEKLSPTAVTERLTKLEDWQLREGKLHLKIRQLASPVALATLNIILI